MERAKQLQMTGYTAFLLNGLCAISCGIVVNLLQEIYGFSYGVAGTLVALYSIGNMAAAFLSGVLPAKIGTRNTVAILCTGFFLGYLLMALTGSVPVLMAAFCMVGLAKGCGLNNCTILVGNNSQNRSRDMSVMHGCYALGALLCPFLISAMAGVGEKMPMIAIAAMGLVYWLVFYAARLPGNVQQTAAKEKTQLDFLKSPQFWLLTGMIFCQNGAETAVTGWLVTYFKDQQILSGILSTYTVTILWGATLIARLLIAFVFRIKDTYKALAVMGAFCTVLYGAMLFSNGPVSAVLLLFGFAFAIAGVNPMAVGATGRVMSPASMGVMLPLAALGAVVMPWIIGLVADTVSLQAGMICNLVPCMGILVLSLQLKRMEKKKTVEG